LMTTWSEASATPGQNCPRNSATEVMKR
jgi:hypothetical protein